MPLDTLRRTAGTMRSIALDADYRSSFLTRLTRGTAVHQDVTQTFPDRYPRLFGEMQRLIGRDTPVRLLSYGCSSGEEVISLRHYFPNATVIGVEINRRMLKACRALPADRQVMFMESTPEGIAAHGPYDAIFGMAVFQRNPHDVEKRGLTDISAHYPFARFDEALAFLTPQLKPGGYMVVEHAQYRVEDSGSAALLDPMPGDTVYPAKGPRFDRDGRIIMPQPVVARIFRKG